jgi:hypothetical protein
VIERAGQAWQLVQRGSQEQYAYVDSAAFNLHSFYSGLEKLFELIARHIDRSLPGGETWHRDLLQRMSQDFPTFGQQLSVRTVPLSSMNSDDLDNWCVTCTRWGYSIRTALWPQEVIFAFAEAIHEVCKLSSRWLKIRLACVRQDSILTLRSNRN